MSGNLKQQLKSLLAAKEYRAAIVLLETSTLPDKQEYIGRIKARMAAEAKPEPPAPEPVKTKGKPLPGAEPVPDKPKSSNRLNFFFIVLVVGVIVATVIAGNRQYVATYRTTRMQLDMERVCRDVYIDNGYEFGQLYNGCQIAAEHSISEYGQEVGYCFDNYHETDARFLNCLADNDVKISEIWIIGAPKD